MGFRANRKRVYDSEREVPRLYFSSPEAAQGWVDWAVAREWWKKQSTIRHVRLVYPSFSMSGAAVLDKRNAKIDVHAYSLDAGTLCHELTHCIDWRENEMDQEALHDAKFAGLNLLTWKHLMGKIWAEKLQAQYEIFKVEWITYE